MRTSVPGATPPERLYGLGNARGFCCQAWNLNWPALNMSGWADVDKAPPGGGAHMLCSHLDDGIKGHGAVMQDAKAYGPSWTYMLTRAAGAAPAAGAPAAEGCTCTPDDAM